jgi:hypothetical protein
MSRRQTFLLALLAVLGPAARAAARPEAPSILCQTYPEAAVCAGRVAECTTCHTSTWPPAWNEFGLQVLANLKGPLVEDLPNALAAIESLDADADGVANGIEILDGTMPGDAADTWPYCEPPAPDGDLPVSDAYDFEHALRRVMVLYCGRSPTYDELAEYRDPEVPLEQLYQSLHQTLDGCLISDYWRGQGLPRLADPRIRPITALGAQSPVNIVIADYAWDYRLFVYVMTEDRDVRDLLLADYHVTAQPDGTLIAVDGAIESPGGPGAPGGQPLEPSRRAGMITTQWFLALNTMGTALPRTSAAQAYRAYLGADIALQQGLFPVAGEPVDVDKKGVTERQCAICHSTLDPLSYAFARYEGAPTALGPTGIYNQNRPAQWIPDWTDNQGVLFGQPVDSLVDWAVAAAESDAFKRNIVDMLFQHAVERTPTPGEQTEFDAIWKALPEDGWSANRAIHRIVDTNAFGARR